VLAIGFVFAVAARSRGLWFAGALALIVNGSLPFVYLSQINRFYSMPLLMLILTLAAMQAPSRSVMTIGTALLALLAVLSHNVIIVVFVLAFLAAVPAFWFGRVSSPVLMRSALAAAISVTAYFLYVRPLVSGWASTGNPTPVLVSFASQAGVPTLALAGLGAWLSWTRSENEPSMLWWALMFAGSLAFLQVTTTRMSWNPRYFLFLMPAMWMLAAHAIEFIARRVRYGSIGVTWYGVVILLLLPNLLSHYQDGSRHDYRQAAAVILANAQPDQPVLSDDAETISYYLPDTVRQHLYVRTKVTKFPVSQFFLVARANAWAPLPQIPHRRMDLVAEIYRRRFDEFSHILRVYRVAPAESE
jgi:hypothetical protein